jgi:hypothetical protein
MSDDDALDELLRAITNLRTDCYLSLAEAVDLELAALRIRSAHPGLKAASDLAGQLEDVPDYVRERLLGELRRVAWETREQVDTSGRLIWRNFGFTVGYKEN